MSRLPTRDKIIVNSQLVNFFKFSESEPKAVVFLHGWRSNGLVWNEIAEKIKEKFSVYTMDLPGFGESDIPEKSFCLDDYVEVVVGFVKKLKLRNVVLVGHSFGGRIAIKVAANYPDLVNKIVLVDSAGLILESVKKNNLRILSKIVKPLFKPSFMKKTRKFIYKKMGAEDYAMTPELKDTFVNIVNEDLFNYLGHIKAKALILWGENDKDTPLKYAEIMNKEILNSKKIVLANAGHFCFLDQPEQFCDELLKFI